MPEPSGAEVLARVTAAGLCHSDLHVQKGYMGLGEEGRLTFAERGAQLPMTFGREIAGVVETVGPEVTTVTPGQQVLVFPWIGCGECEACCEDCESDCSSMRIIGLKQKGGFATHCLVENEKFLVDIEGLDAADVAPHACSGITAYNALEKLGLLRDGEWMAIMGCGGLGMNAIAIARVMGIENIIAVDIDDAKLDAAREMGAAKVMNSKRVDAVAELQRLAEGRLMGVLDTFGGPSTDRLAVRALAKAGRYIVVGQSGGDFKMPQVWLPQKAMTVRGSHVGNSPQLRTLIDMVRAGKPYTGKVWAQIAKGNAEDVARAVAAAKTAFETGPWAEVRPTARGKLLVKLAEIIEREAERLGELEVRDNGKLIAEMGAQTRYLAEWRRYYGGLADKVEGAVPPSDRPGIFNYTKHEPLGVVAMITPWNSPLLLLAWKLAPALAAGNTAVVKPSEFTSASMLEFMELIKEAGFPDSVVNCVTGFGLDVGAPLAEHPDVAKAAFTGSDFAGQKIYEAAAKKIMPVTLELGGKSPNIVFEDADFEAAVMGAISGIFAATGQTCIAESRLVFARDVSRVKVGRCSYNFVLYHHGGMITDGVMLRLAEDAFWMAQADGELTKWYMAHAHEFDVTISDPNVWVTQVQGPRSMDVLRDVIDGDFPDPWRYFDIATVSIAGEEVIITLARI